MVVEPDDTGEKQAVTRFKRGVSGNPAGRPKGARSKLGAAFLEALADNFDKYGIETIEKVRQRDPVAYVKVIKDVLPREVVLRAFTEHNINVFSDAAEIQDAKEFAAAFAVLERAARELVGIEEPAAMAYVPEEEETIEAE
jgi:hypothetical protein